MQDKIIMRMRDGARVELPVDQVKEEILAAAQDAADRGKIAELNSDELEQLFEVFADTNRIVAVKPGEEVITADNSALMSLINDQADGGEGLPLSSMQSILAYERVCCADTVGIGHTDYRCKPVKPIVNYEKQMYYSVNCDGDRQGCPHSGSPQCENGCFRASHVRVTPHRLYDEGR